MDWTEEIGSYRNYKTRDMTNSNNWRPTVLTDLTNIVFARIIFEKLRNKIHKILGEKKADFRIQMSYIDQIYTLNTIRDVNNEIPGVFVDIEKTWKNVENHVFSRNFK